MIPRPVNYKRFILFCLSFLALLTSYAKREPSWMKSMPLPSNSTYIYARESGEGATQDDALKMALVHVFGNTASRLGVPFDEQRAFSAMQNGANYELISTQYNIPVRFIDSYTTKLSDGKYFVTVLCQVIARRNVAPVWEKGQYASATEDSPSLVKSIFLPGLGQMSKGRVGSGTLTLLGEVAFIGGAAGASVMALKELDRLDECSLNHDIAGWQAAKRDYDTWRIASYYAWGAAGVLYVWNLIRAYTIKPKAEPSFAFEPSLISAPSTISPSIGFTFRF